MPVGSDGNISIGRAFLYVLSRSRKPLLIRDRQKCLSCFGVLLAFILCGCAKEPAIGPNGEPVALRVGYFPNITHAQPLIGIQRDDFQKSIGPDVKLIAQTFNAGPAVIEAVYAGHLDIAYVGPSPILNGFLQSKGEEVRVIAGSATNGVTVVGSKKRGITKFEQFKGGRIATPQFANTQDISARHYITHELGAKLKSDGGETDIIPIANPDIETLFAKDQLDAAWVPEPWGSRLIHKNLAVQVIEEKELWPDKSFANTSVIARRAFVEKNPDLVRRFLEAHVRITRELQRDPQSFAGPINAELKRITTKSLPDEVVAGALRRTGFSVNPSVESFKRFFKMGKEVGIIKAETLDAEKLFVTGPLEKAVAAVDGASVSATTSQTSTGLAQ